MISHLYVNKKKTLRSIDTHKYQMVLPEPQFDFQLSSIDNA